MRKQFTVYLILFIISGCSKEDLDPEIPEVGINSITEDPINDKNNYNSNQHNTIGSSAPLDSGGNNLGEDSSDGIDFFNDPLVVNFGCENWVAPIHRVGEKGFSIDIYYDPLVVPINEINCVRQEFFQRWSSLRMSRIQDDDPYHDVWMDTAVCDPLDLECSNGGSAGSATPNATKDAERDRRTCVRKKC